MKPRVRECCVLLIFTSLFSLLSVSANGEQAPTTPQSKEGFAIRRKLDPLLRSSGGLWNGMTALQFETVRNELSLSDSQNKAVTSFNEKALAQIKQLGSELLPPGQPAPREARAADEAKVDAFLDDKMNEIKRLLEPRQLERLDQLVLQLKGNDAFWDASVVKALGLSAEQESRIKRAISEHKRRYRNTRLVGGTVVAAQNAEDAAKRRADLKRIDGECEAAILQILSEAQQEKLKSMKGTAFDCDPVVGRN